MEVEKGPEDVIRGLPIGGRYGTGKGQVRGVSSVSVEDCCS